MQYEYLSLTELRKLLDEKKVSSVELTRYFLDRIKKHDKDLNSFITVCEKEAIDAAKNADDFINSPGENPFLCGIPYAAKDMFCTKGVRTTAASKILDNYVPPYDATVIAKLKSEKAVLLGKTNQDQFAHGSSGETSAYGPTKNPWDKTRMPGGSSSGSGVAVSAGLAPFALGTETGGSIRVPAHMSGVCGWKPTYGRVSRYGVVSMASSLDSIGALALSIEDISRLAEAMAGQDRKDSTTGFVEVPKYSKNLNLNLKGLKVGIPKEYFIEGMEKGVADRVNEAILNLQELGAELVEVSMPTIKYGGMVYAIVCPSEVSSNLAKYDGIRFGYVTKDAKDLMEVYAKSRAEGFGDEAKRRIMTGTYVLSAGYYDAYYKKAQKVRRLIVNEFAEVFKKVDVLAAPVFPNVAQKLGHAADDPLFGYIGDLLNFPASMAGACAVSVPCGFARPSDGETPSMDGLPVGLQIMGPQFGEQKIFNVGYAYQQVTDWHKKHPNLE
jgi:aspartyl-tRNA(Asn)/glutamyl-tRNA(Gln) amidotransferase subunit A